jgi:hypothetical protein
MNSFSLELLMPKNVIYGLKMALEVQDPKNC